MTLETCFSVKNDSFFVVVLFDDLYYIKKVTKEFFAR
jgi:hypothetical protein